MLTYVAAFIPCDDHWSVLFADFELATQGDSLENAFFSAQDALNGRLQSIAEDGEQILNPLSMDEAKNKIIKWCDDASLKLPKNTIFQLVPTEKPKTKLVNFTISLPETIVDRIDTKAKMLGVSRNKFFAISAQAYQI